MTTVDAQPDTSSQGQDIEVKTSVQKEDQLGPAEVPDTKDAEVGENVSCDQAQASSSSDADELKPDSKEFNVNSFLVDFTELDQSMDGVGQLLMEGLEKAISNEKIIEEYSSQIEKLTEGLRIKETNSKQLHDKLVKVADQELEIVKLSSALSKAEEELQYLTKEKETSTKEWIETRQNLETDFKQKLQQSKDENKKKTLELVTNLETQLEERGTIIDQLQIQLTDLENAKKSEIMKIQLECDSKLQQLEEKLQLHTHDSSRNAALEKQLEEERVQADRQVASMEKEINNLKRKVAQLEETHSGGKRKKGKFNF